MENVRENCSYNQGFVRINLDGFGFKGDDVYKIVSSLSGGERVKVALCKILLSDNNLLILDEPTNYLDIKAMEALEKVLINTEKTVIIVCHDRKFIGNICDYIIEINNKSIKEFDYSYKHYINEKNKPRVSNEEKVDKEKLLLAQIKLSEVISLLSVEKDKNKKEKLEHEYKNLLQDVKKLKN